MEINEALEQLEEIHHHVSRLGFYRGYRSIFVAFTGFSGLLAAYLQPKFVTSPLSFVYYWVVVAILNFLVSGGSVLHRFWFHESRMERQKTGQAIGQFWPSLAAGTFFTIAVCRFNESFIAFLPPLWLFLFGLAIYSSRPYLPAPIQWAAAYFFAAGLVLLGIIPQGLSLHPWGMGMGFGLGLLGVALLLYFNLERKEK